MRALPALLAATALLAAACSGDDPSTDASDATTTRDGTDGSAGNGDDPASGSGGNARFVRGLVAFDDCDAFLGHVQTEARDRVGPYGLDGERVWPDDMAMDETAEEPASEPADGGTNGSVPGGAMGGDDQDSGFTGTNVQVAGVDEPDLVKTDGRRILTVSENVLSLIDITSGAPALSDQLRLPTGWGHELFFRGDRALLFTNSGSWGTPMPVDVFADDGLVDAEAEFATGSLPPGDAIWPGADGRPTAEIIEIDLSDPSELRIVASMQIEGQYLSARAIDDHVRLAVTSVPDHLPWLFPQTPAGEQRALEANRATIDESTIDDWLPQYELTGPDGTTRGSLLECSAVHHPAEFAGLDIVSVIDLDLGQGLQSADEAVDAVGVLAGGQTVASSMDRFYVATTKWVPPGSGDASVDDDQLRQWSEDYVTELHAFAIAPGEPTTYVGSGSVPGTLLDQFSLDEHEGDLRVVHTDGSPWSQDDLSETFLTVLREDRDELVEIGSVGGLGRGEQLYSARLMGDVGFAVTFRQIDPFYVLDLSDPTNPRVAGELKIPGFSTYLHPLGDDLVLGVGQDALDTGQVTGLKLSLFDVSDPVSPQEVSVWTLPNAYSPVESDHRAFQIWDSTAIVPVQSWNGAHDGVILFDLTDGIIEIGRTGHDAGGSESDCRVIAAEDLTPGGSDLAWMAQEGRIQVCGADAIGG